MDDTYKRFADYDKIFQGTKSQLIFLPCIMKRILSVFRGRILDIGTGNGHRLQTIIENSSMNNITEIIALEPSPLYEIARKELRKHRKVKVLNKNLSDFRSKKKFDVILMFDVLEHLKSPEQAILHIKNLLASDGIFVCSTPNRRVYNFFYIVTGRGIDETHINVLTTFEFRSLIRKFFNQAAIIGVPPFSMGLYRFLPKSIRPIIDFARFIPLSMNNYAFMRNINER